MSPAMMVPGNQDSLDCQLLKGVRHLTESGIQHVPWKYILPVGERPDAFDHEKSTGLEKNVSLPVIDFADLKGENRSQVIESLAYACENYGFFQLVNHGIPDEVISNMMNVSRNFFEMPFSEREKYMSGDTSAPVRYGTSFNQAKDGIFFWRDFLKLVCHPLQDVLPHWPSAPTEFRQSAVTYAKETRKLCVMIMEAILESMGLTGNDMSTKTQYSEDNDSCSILKEIENGSQLMVLNCYPPCPEPDLTLGMPPHSDYGFLTLLYQDDVSGLQIHHQDKWVTIHPVPKSFIINIGDHLEIFSNGKYKSVLHRVMVNSTRNRISVASLHSLPFTSTVRPSPKLTSDTNPRLYKDTDFACFLEYIKSCDSQKKNFLESRKLKP